MVRGKGCYAEIGQGQNIVDKFCQQQVQGLD